MERRSAAARSTQHDSPERTTEASSGRRGGPLRRRIARLAVAIAPVVATVVVSAPAGAWPEIGG